MTIQDVFDRLRPIEKAAGELIRDTGFDPDDGLSGKVRHLPDACEDAFLRDKAEGILGSLEDAIREICYLRKPLHGEHTLRKLPNGRYGYTGRGQAVREFTCGDCLEAKIRDRDGNFRWITASIEHDGLDYFLVGAMGAPLAASRSGKGGERHDFGPETTGRIIPLQRDRAPGNRGIRPIHQQ